MVVLQKELLKYISLTVPFFSFFTSFLYAYFTFSNIDSYCSLCKKSKFATEIFVLRSNEPKTVVKYHSVCLYVCCRCPCGAKASGKTMRPIVFRYTQYLNLRPEWIIQNKSYLVLNNMSIPSLSCSVYFANPRV